MMTCKHTLKAMIASKESKLDATINVLNYYEDAIDKGKNIQDAGRQINMLRNQAFEISKEIGALKRGGEKNIIYA